MLLAIAPQMNHLLDCSTISGPCPSQTLNHCGSDGCCSTCPTSINLLFIPLPPSPPSSSASALHCLLPPTWSPSFLLTTVGKKLWSTFYIDRSTCYLSLQPPLLTLPPAYYCYPQPWSTLRDFGLWINIFYLQIDKNLPTLDFFCCSVWHISCFLIISR